MKMKLFPQDNYKDPVNIYQPITSMEITL